MAITASDNFNRANGALGAAWSGAGNGKIVSNHFEASAVNIYGASVHGTVMSHPDGYVQCTGTAPGGSANNPSVWLMLRSDSNAWHANSYLATFGDDQWGNKKASIFKVVNWDIGAAKAEANWAGFGGTTHTFRFECQGNVLRAYVDGTLVVTWSDPSAPYLSAGYTGLNVNVANATANCYADDFETGTLSGSSSPGTAAPSSVLVTGKPNAPTVKVNGVTQGGSTGTGVFRLEGARIVDPNGNEFWPIGGCVVGNMYQGVGTYPNQIQNQTLEPWYAQTQAVNGRCGRHGPTGPGTGVWGTAEGHSEDAVLDGWNAIRLSTWRPNPSGDTAEVSLQSCIDGVSRCIDEYTARGIVCIVDTHDLTSEEGLSNDTSNPLWARVHSSWTTWFARHKDNPYFWCNYTNEPIHWLDSVSYQNWHNLNTSLYNRARAAGFTGMFVVDLPNWAQDIAGLATTNLGENFIAAGNKYNVVFAWHNYGSPGGSNDKAAMTQYVDMIRAKNLPLILTECGCDWDDVAQRGGGCNLPYSTTRPGVEWTFDNAKAKKIGAMPWGMVGDNNLYSPHKYAGSCWFYSHRPVGKGGLNGDCATYPNPEIYFNGEPTVLSYTGQRLKEIGAQRLAEGWGGGGTIVEPPPPPPPATTNNGLRTGPFRTVGKDILDANNLKVVPLGANVGVTVEYGAPTPQYAFAQQTSATCPTHPGHPPWGTASGHADDALLHGWNCVRINFVGNQGAGVSIEQMTAAVNAAITEYSAKKIICMPEAHDFTGADPADISTDSRWAAVHTAWDQILAAHGNNPYLWVNYLNEAFTGASPSWSTVWTQLYNRVRAKGFTGIFVVDCAGWGQDVGHLANTSAGTDFMSGKNNVVFSWHNYGATGDKPTMSSLVNTVINTKGLPLIVGEAGCDWAGTRANSGLGFATERRGAEWCFDNAEMLGTGVLVWHGNGTATPDDMYSLHNGGWGPWYTTDESGKNGTTTALTRSFVGQRLWDLGQARLSASSNVTNATVTLTTPIRGTAYPIALARVSGNTQQHGSRPVSPIAVKSAMVHPTVTATSIATDRANVHITIQSTGTVQVKIET